MKKLELKQMEMIEGGKLSTGRASLACAAGLACAELGHVSFAVGAATYAGCVQLKS